MANNPAARENSNTSPLGTFFPRIASMVSCFDTVTVAMAIACLSVFDFDVISTIIIDSLSIDGFHLPIFQLPKSVTPL